MAPATLLGALLAGMLFAAATPAQVLTLEPVADTYVEPGLEGTWDHGGCRFFDVDSKPLGISYLKFDLTGLAANRYVGCAGDACFGDGTPSRVSFPAVAGTTYLIMVWGEAYPHSGTLVFRLSQVDVCEG
jgi:hypothetical protein